MKTILVPTDFSDYALYALKAAASIAKKIHARIILVHVYNLPTAGVSQFAYYENFFNELRVNAEQQLGRLANSSFLKNIPIERQLITDKLIWEIVSEKKYKKVDLIVMGTHGKSGFNRFFIGSNTDKVVRLADAPVLTIKNEFKSFNIKRIVFSSDYQEESYAAFKKIRFFIDAFKAELVLLKVITPSAFESTPEGTRLIQKFIRKFHLKKCSFNIYNYSDIESGIINFIKANKADLIAIPTHGKTGISHLISGSLAESLVRHEPKPILSIKIPRTPAQKYTPTTKLSHAYNYENWGEG